MPELPNVRFQSTTIMDVTQQGQLFWPACFSGWRRPCYWFGWTGRAA